MHFAVINSESIKVEPEKGNSFIINPIVGETSKKI